MPKLANWATKIFGRVSQIFQSATKEGAAMTKIGDKSMPGPTAELNPEGPNSHLSEYIKYYRTLERPGFAVLVTGEWGTGKTHLLKQLLPWEGDQKQSHYVSFFGLKNADEVYAAVYAEMYPSLSIFQEKVKGLGEATRGVSAFGVGVGGLLSGGATLLSAYMRKDIDISKPIIFDDLERSSMETAEEKLGVINYYVEHEHCRVIVIAHDAKLVEGIIEAKEKIFGQTIRIEPDAHSAFANFKSQMAKNKITTLVGLYENDIVNLFIKSETRSLRILRHAMFDLERFFSTLEERHIENENAIRDLVQLFVAIDIGVRNNTISSESIRKRVGAGLSREMRKISASRKGEAIEFSQFEKLQTLYPGIDLENQILNDDVIVDMLIRGRYLKYAICESLQNSSYFAKANTLPPWRRVAEFDRLPDDLVEDAARALNEQFETRTVTETGEMLHVFALRMMMAKHGIIDGTVEKIAEENKKYIDALLSEGRLPPLDTSTFDQNFSMSISNGFGFWVEESYKELFSAVFKHLEANMRLALESTYPKIGEQLLTLLQKEPREFAGAISYIHGGSHKLAALPVMNAVPLESFIKTWLNAPNRGETWNWTRIGFEQRYSDAMLSGPLSSEAKWIHAVLVEMRCRAKSETGFKRLRMERAIPKLKLPELSASPSPAPAP
jgi:hypothetical protein